MTFITNQFHKLIKLSIELINSFNYKLKKMIIITFIYIYIYIYNI